MNNHHQNLSKRLTTHLVRAALLATLIGLLTACGGGGTSDDPAADDTETGKSDPNAGPGTGGTNNKANCELGIGKLDDCTLG